MNQEANPQGAHHGLDGVIMTRTVLMRANQQYTIYHYAG